MISSQTKQALNFFRKTAATLIKYGTQTYVPATSSNTRSATQIHVSLHLRRYSDKEISASSGLISVYDRKAILHESELNGASLDGILEVIIASKKYEVVSIKDAIDGGIIKMQLRG